ncbi:hypothetical protein J6590_004276 [Homalodisca vitripennis]|nr:hypothetical protein J6590_004276 [Homalodisca vitripennis]
MLHSLLANGVSGLADLLQVHLQQPWLMQHTGFVPLEKEAFKGYRSPFAQLQRCQSFKKQARFRRREIFGIPQVSFLGPPLFPLAYIDSDDTRALSARA